MLEVSLPLSLGHCTRTLELFLVLHMPVPQLWEGWHVDKQIPSEVAP